jgi:hypothetical protein
MLHEDLLKNFEKLVNGYDFFVPSQKFLNISRDGTKKVIAGDNLDESWLGRNRPRVADNGAGGVCIMSRKGFYEVCGWEPSIGSWCPEDELMRSKVDTFDLKVGRSPYDMYHLDHDTKAHRKLARLNDKKQWKEMVEKIAVFKQMRKQELIGHYVGIGEGHYR